MNKDISMDKGNDPEWVRMMRLAEEIRRFSNLYTQKTAKGSTYSAQEADILFRIELEDGLLSPLELSHKMGVSKPIVSRLIDRLSTKGAIEKVTSSNDKRSYYLKLTQKGHDVLRSAYVYYSKPVKLLSDKLSSDQFHTLFQLISLANEL